MIVLVRVSINIQSMVTAAKILIIGGAILDSVRSVTKAICALIAKKGMREKMKFSNPVLNAKLTISIGSESAL